MLIWTKTKGLMAESNVIFLAVGWRIVYAPWSLTLKINRVPDSPKDYVCAKFGQNPLKDVDSRVLRGKNLTPWPWHLTYDLENQTLIIVFTRMLRKDGRKNGRTEGRTVALPIYLRNFVGEGITKPKKWVCIQFILHFDATNFLSS